MIPLQKPDFQVLKWSEHDTKSGSVFSRALGATLEAGLHLYRDLQRTYLTAAQEDKTTSEVKGGVKKGATEDEKHLLGAGNDGYEDDVSKRGDEEKISPYPRATTSREKTNTEYEDDGYDLPKSDTDTESSPIPGEGVVSSAITSDGDGYAYAVEQDNDLTSDGHT